jgi:hypothetical protein
MRETTAVGRKLPLSYNACMRHVVLVVLFALVAGCATPRPDVLSKTETYAPTTNVEILLEPPKRGHKLFALLEDRAGGTPEEINARLADVGRELGADAILITEVRNESATEWLMVGTSYYFRRGGIGFGYQPVQRTYRSVRAQALKYLDSPEKK